MSEFKEHLDATLGSYGLVSGSPVRSREWNFMIIKGPIQLQIFHDSVIALDIKLKDLYCVLMNLWNKAICVIDMC